MTFWRLSPARPVGPWRPTAQRIGSLRLPHRWFDFYLSLGDLVNLLFGCWENVGKVLVGKFILLLCLFYSFVRVFVVAFVHPQKWRILTHRSKKWFQFDLGDIKTEIQNLHFLYFPTFSHNPNKAVIFSFSFSFFCL